MRSLKQQAKYFIIWLLAIVWVGNGLAQVTIPTGLTNAVQYIMQTVWTDDGTDNGTTNVQIDDNNIYIRTGFLNNGTGWNNKALWVDSSGNVVYVDANGINTPFLNLSWNYIPKINQAGNELELSTMFQSTLGNIGIWLISPTSKVHVQWDFRIDTISWSIMQYTYTVWAVVVGAVTPPNSTQLCDCDSDPLQHDCATPSFTTSTQQGNGWWLCVDITSSGWWSRDYQIYNESIGNINQWAFFVTGDKAGIMTLNPLANLHVHGNAIITNITNNPSPQDVLVHSTSGEIQKVPVSYFAGTPSRSLQGNEGTQSTNFIGTTDAQSLRMRVNNTQIWQLSPNGSLMRGFGNTIYGNRSTIIGWEENLIDGNFSSILWGEENQITGSHSATIWSNNYVSWNNSVAMWQNALASGNNSFVWNDWINQASNYFDREFVIESDRVRIWPSISPSIPWFGRQDFLRLVSLYYNYDINTYLGWSIWTPEIYAYSGYFSNLYSFNWNISPSDERLKTNIQSGNQWASSWLSLINSLNPIIFNREDNSYTKNSPLNTTETHYGFIAQQVETIIPEIISEFDSNIIWAGEGAPSRFKWVKVNEIIPILVQAIKEQQVLIDDLEARITALEP